MAELHKVPVKKVRISINPVMGWEQYTVSDVCLARVCRLLRVPLPGRGYWAKRAAGKTTKKRPPLLPLPAEKEQMKN